MRKLGVFLVLVGAQIVVGFLRALAIQHREDNTWPWLTVGASLIALGLLALLWSSRWPVLTSRSRIYGTAYLILGTFAAASPFPIHRTEAHVSLLLLAGLLALMSAAVFAASLELGQPAVTQTKKKGNGK